MDALGRYRKRVLGNPETAKSPFIEKALNKIVINKYESGDILDIDLEAVLIFRDKEGPDQGILYTYADDGLVVGDSFVKKGEREENDVYFLIIEEVKRVDTSVEIRVYRVLETNINIKNKKETRPAYLLSNLRNKIRVSQKEGNQIEVKNSILVAPKGYKLSIDQKLNLENLKTKEESYSSWRIYGIDDVSSPSIVYAHLEQILKTEETEKEEDTRLRRSQIVNLETENGFVEIVGDAKLVKRSASEVQVQAPSFAATFQVKVIIDSIVIIHEFEVR